MKFISPEDVMQLSDADEAQAGRLMEHCAENIRKQRDGDPTLKQFVVSTAVFSKTEKNNDDKDNTGLSVKVRVAVEENAAAEGWKVSYDAKTGLTFKPKRTYSKRAPAAPLVVEKTDAPETPAANVA